MVQLPNGETVSVTHIGTVIFSVSSFTKFQPSCLVLLFTFCFIQDLTSWRTIGVGHAVDRLYLLQCGTSHQPSYTILSDFLVHHKLGDVFHPFTTAMFSGSLSSLWHARLGHPSDVKLQALGQVFPFSQKSCNDLCKVCPLAKQKRLLFPFNNKLSSYAFDLIHLDVWGPYATPTLDGFKYFLTVVDDAIQQLGCI